MCVPYPTTYAVVAHGMGIRYGLFRKAYFCQKHTKRSKEYPLILVEASNNTLSKG